MARDPMTGMERHPVRPSSAIGVRWFYVVLLALIAIAAIVGVVSTASMGQTPLAIAIGLIAVAFFSRIGA
ncbi:hypothetical protein [Mycolicibacterium phlei]